MNRQEEALKIAEELLEDIEFHRLKPTDIVLKASRLARLTGHARMQEFLALERTGYRNTPEEAEWIDLTGRRDRNSDNGRAWVGSTSDLEATVEAAKAATLSLQGGGNYSGDNAAIASRNHDQRIAQNSVTIAQFSAVTGRVTSVIYDMTTEIYHELLFSDIQASLFQQAQEEINGVMAQAGGSALSKIESMNERLRDGDPESISQALTTCRRLIDAVADHLFPADDAPFAIGETTISVKQGNVLNRLQAYLYKSGVQKSRRDRLRRSLMDLYDRCSAGTHAEVDVIEARYVSLATYVALGEILAIGSQSSL